MSGKEYKAEWYQKNKERLYKIKKENREAIREYDRKRYKNLSLEMKDKEKEASRKSYLKNRDKILKKSRERHLLKNYNLTSKQYFELIKEQENLCAICGKPEHCLTKTGDVKPLSVDHNHTTGEVRMLLCNDCNALLGFCKEDAKILEAALRYLEFWQVDYRMKGY